jgi:hypothetical protein
VRAPAADGKEGAGVERHYGFVRREKLWRGRTPRVLRGLKQGRWRAGGQTVKRVRNPEGGAYRVRQARVIERTARVSSVLKGTKPHERHRKAAAVLRSPASGQALKEAQPHERSSPVGLAPPVRRPASGRPQDLGPRADGLGFRTRGRVVEGMQGEHPTNRVLPGGARIRCRGAQLHESWSGFGRVVRGAEGFG